MAMHVGIKASQDSSAATSNDTCAVKLALPAPLLKQPPAAWHHQLPVRPRLTCRKRASSMRAPMRRFISSSFFSLSSNVEGSMLGNSLSATCG